MICQQDAKCATLVHCIAVSKGMGRDRGMWEATTTHAVKCAVCVERGFGATKRTETGFDQTGCNTLLSKVSRWWPILLVFFSHILSRVLSFSLKQTKLFRKGPSGETVDGEAQPRTHKQDQAATATFLHPQCNPGSPLLVCTSELS